MLPQSGIVGVGMQPPKGTLRASYAKPMGEAWFSRHRVQIMIQAGLS